MSSPKCHQSPTLTRVRGGVLEQCADGKRRLFSTGKCYGTVEKTADRKWWACPHDGRRQALCNTRDSAVDYLFGRAALAKVQS